jgi:hypothetical protein
VIGGALNELRAAHDLPPDLGLEMLYRHLALSPAGIPRSGLSPPASAHSFRATGPRRLSPAAWPRLYSFWARSSTSVGRPVQPGAGRLRDCVKVVATVGEGIDSAEFGPQPANVRSNLHSTESILPERCLVVSTAGRAACCARPRSAPGVASDGGRSAS